MEIKLTISEEQKDRAISAVCNNYGYRQKVNNEKGLEINNPETPEVFFKRKVIEYIKENIEIYETKVEIAKIKIDNVEIN